MKIHNKMKMMKMHTFTHDIHMSIHDDMPARLHFLRIIKSATCFAIAVGLHDPARSCASYTHNFDLAIVAGRAKGAFAQGAKGVLGAAAAGGSQNGANVSSFVQRSPTSSTAMWRATAMLVLLRLRSSQLKLRKTAFWAAWKRWTE